MPANTNDPLDRNPISLDLPIFASITGIDTDVDLPKSHKCGLLRPRDFGREWSRNAVFVGRRRPIKRDPASA